ncbi:hypothetical protein RB595_002505 [Gaeumannomyces hyphopodioides]
MFPDKNSARDQPQLRRSQRLSGYARSSSSSAGVAKTTTPPRSTASRSSRESEAILQTALQGLALRSGTRLPPGGRQQQPAAKPPGARAVGTPPPSPPPSPAPAANRPGSPPPTRYPIMTCFRHKGHGAHVIRIVQCPDPVLRKSVFTGAEGQRVARIERLPLEPGASIRVPPGPLARRPDAPRPVRRKLEHFQEGDRHFVRVQLGMI